MTDEQKAKVEYFYAVYYIYSDVPETSVTRYDEVVTPDSVDDTNNENQSGDS